MHPLGDIWEYHEHLGSEGIGRILPEEVLREISHLESCCSLDRPLVFSLSTDDHLEESSLPSSIFADEGHLVTTRDDHIGTREEFRLFDVLGESGDRYEC
jgi:hypothetical protein